MPEVRRRSARTALWEHDQGKVKPMSQRKWARVELEFCFMKLLQSQGLSQGSSRSFTLLDADYVMQKSDDFDLICSELDGLGADEAAERFESLRRKLHSPILRDIDADAVRVALAVYEPT